MRKLWSFFVCLALVLGLGLAEAPRPCLGDGHGAACEATHCRCDATCTCHLAHEQAAAADTLVAYSMCNGNGNGNGNVLDPQEKQRLTKLACHGGTRGPSFAAPLKHWTAGLAALPRPLNLTFPWACSPRLYGGLLNRALAPPEYPPRALV